MRAAASLIAYLSRPLRGGSLGVLVVFALLVSLALSAGLFGLWLLLLLAVALSAYAFRLLDGTAEGRREPPVMGVEHFNPVTERRPLWLLLACWLGYLSHEGVSAFAPGWAATLWAWLLATLLPAAIGILGLRTDQPAWILYPIALLRTAREMGPHYLMCLAALALGVVLYRYTEDANLIRPVAVFVQLYALFVVFSIVGGTLYNRRVELGTATVDSPEQRDARRDREEQRALNSFEDEIYRLTRAGELQRAYDAIGQRLAGADDRLGLQRMILEALLRWEDKRLALRVARDLVSELIAARQSGAALEITGRCLQCDPAFRPARAAEAIRLVNEARSRGRPGLARQLLSDFEEHYPGDPALPVALELRED